MKRASKVWTGLLGSSLLIASFFSTFPAFAASVKHTADQGTGFMLVGAAASPPTGLGDGRLLAYDTGKGSSFSIPLTTGANAFRVAVVGDKAYVPTEQGITYVVDLHTHEILSQFVSAAGARIANVTSDGHLLLITGPKSVTAYALPSLKKIWMVDAGGNALAVSKQYAYLAGNARKDTLVIDLLTGRIQKSIAIGRIEDAAYDGQSQTLWLADWYNGAMTVVNTKTNTIQNVIQTSEGDPQLNPKEMMMTTAGFMQLAVGPKGAHVYAAGFSGHILEFNAKTDTLEKSIAVGTLSKLSGLAISPNGMYAYTTVENKKETDVVSLRSGKVVQIVPGLAANRWLVAQPD